MATKNFPQNEDAFFDDELFGDAEEQMSPPSPRAAGALGIVLHLSMVFSWLWLALMTLGLIGAVLYKPAAEISENRGIIVTGDLLGVVPKPVLILGMVMMVLGVIIALLIIHQLRKITTTLRAGDPFVPINARRLSKIWMIMAGGEIIRMGLAYALSIYVRRESSLNFANHWVGDLTGLNDGTGFVLRWPIWFCVLILIALAQVFRQGALLRRDQQLTV